MKEQTTILQFTNTQKNYFRNGAWKSKEMSRVEFSLHLDRFNLHYSDQNQHPFILKDIHETIFPNLKKIFLQDNQIQSIEGVNRVQMPKLQALFLNNNNIVSTEDFRKGRWQCLQTINLNKNNVKVLYLEFSLCRNLKFINNGCESSANLAKLIGKQLRILYTKTTSTAFLEAMKKKYPQLYCH